MITSTLDLDRGTLSFAINGLDLGVAVEGLVGPLYPTFSLYNLDDQLTLVTPTTAGLFSRQFSASSLPEESHESMWSSSSTERVLNR